MASRLTVLYGPSGVGKSSLLRAGVARRLRALVPASGAVEEGAEVVVVDAWRDDPVAARGGRRRGARSTSRSADALAERALASGGVLYVVLDQMEEYVLYHGRDGGPLAAELEDVLTQTGVPVHVLLGVRDDALADLDAFKRRVPGLFGNVLRLDHLTRAAARRAIEGPLQATPSWAGRGDGRARSWSRQCSTRSRRADRAAPRGRGLVEEGRRERRVEAPYLQLVLERLWEAERERGSSVLRLRRSRSSAARGGLSRSTSSTRWRGSTRRNGISSRASSTTSSRRRARRSRTAWTTRAATRASTGAARACAGRSRVRASFRSGPQRRAAAVRDLPRRPRAGGARVACWHESEPRLSAERAKAKKRRRRLPDAALG